MGKASKQAGEGHKFGASLFRWCYVPRKSVPIKWGTCTRWVVATLPGVGILEEREKEGRNGGKKEGKLTRFSGRRNDLVILEEKGKEKRLTTFNNCRSF